MNIKIRKAELIALSVISTLLGVCVISHSFLIKMLSFELAILLLVWSHLAESKNRISLESGFKWLISWLVSLSLVMPSLIYLGYTLGDFNDSSLIQNLPSLSTLPGVQISVFALIVGSLAKFAFAPNLFFMANLLDLARPIVVLVYFCFFPLFLFLSSTYIFVESIRIISDSLYYLLCSLCVISMIYGTLVLAVQIAPKRMIASAFQLVVATMFFIWVMASRSGQSFSVSLFAVSFSTISIALCLLFLVVDRSDKVGEAKSRRVQISSGAIWMIVSLFSFLFVTTHPNLLAPLILSLESIGGSVMLIVAFSAFLYFSMVGFRIAKTNVKATVFVGSSFFVLLQLWLYICPDPLIELINAFGGI